MAFANTFIEKPVRTSNFDLSKTVSFSTTPGLIVPFYHRTTYPGDKFFLRWQLGIETLPLQTPLLSSFRSRVAWFWLPWRAVNPKMHFNIGFLDAQNIRFPMFAPFPYVPDPEAGGQADPNIYLPPYGVAPDPKVHHAPFVAPSSLVNYLYWPAYKVFWRSSTDDPASPFDEANGIPFFMYYDVFYHWYANWQQDTFPMVSAWPGTADNANIPIVPTEPSLSYLSDVSLSDLQNWLLRVQLNNGSAMVFSDGSNFFGNLVPWRLMENTYGGLCCCTFKPDVLTAYVNSSLRNTIQQRTSVDTSGGSFSIDSFIQAERIKKFLELGFLGSSGFRDWVYAQFGVTPSRDTTTPTLLCHRDTYLNFNTVVATSSDGLGDLGGRGSGGYTTPLHRFNFQEYGTLMAFHTLTPEVSYPNSVNIENFRSKLSEYPAPILNNIAWQPLLRGQQFCRNGLVYPNPQSPEELKRTNFWFSADSDNFNRLHSVVGYQPAWSESMTDFDQSYGSLATDLSYWMLNRDFAIPVSKGGSIEEWMQYGTYINPRSFNSPFVDNSPSASNFLVQVRLDIRARRPFAKKAIPSI